MLQAREHGDTPKFQVWATESPDLNLLYITKLPGMVLQSNNIVVEETIHLIREKSHSEFYVVINPVNHEINVAGNLCPHEQQ